MDDEYEEVLSVELSEVVVLKIILIVNLPVEGVKVEEDLREK